LPLGWPAASMSARRSALSAVIDEGVVLCERQQTFVDQCADGWG
jgi:hypothetical protein